MLQLTEYVRLIYKQIRHLLIVNKNSELQSNNASDPEASISNVTILISNLEPFHGDLNKVASYFGIINPKSAKFYPSLVQFDELPDELQENIVSLWEFGAFRGGALYEYMSGKRKLSDSERILFIASGLKKKDLAIHCLIYKLTDLA